MLKTRFLSGCFLSILAFLAIETARGQELDFGALAEIMAEEIAEESIDDSAVRSIEDLRTIQSEAVRLCRKATEATVGVR